MIVRAHVNITLPQAGLSIRFSPGTDIRALRQTTVRPAAALLMHRATQQINLDASTCGSRKLQHFKVLLVLIVFGLTGCNDDAGDPVGQPVVPLESGLQTITSGGVEREFFLALTGAAGQAGVASAGAGMSQVAANGDGMSQVAAHENDADRPLIFALHGYTSHYTVWVGETRSNDLIDVVGDHAVFVAPQGREDASGNTFWGGEPDLDFFVDMLREFSERGLVYNRNKIFVVGHSNGGNFTHLLGCAHGENFRAIVSWSGSLTSTDCVGSAAVMFMHGGDTDPLGSIDIALATRQYWVLYNGWDSDAFVPAYTGRCDDYSFPDQPDNLPYPVLWCLHDQGHDIPNFGSEVAWDFLTSLPEVEGTPDSPPGGGAERATPPIDAFAVFQLDAPADMPRPLRGAFSFRRLSHIDNPTCSAPDIITRPQWSPDGLVIAGQVSEPIRIPFTYQTFPGGGTLTFPSEWALSITVYVEGGSDGVTPTPGVDYNTITPVMLVSRNTDIVIDEVLPLGLVADLCN